MPKIKNWEKISETRWQFRNDIPSVDSMDYPLTAEIHIIEHNTAINDYPYELEMSLEKKISDNTTEKIDGYLSGTFSSKQKAIQEARALAKSVTEPSDMEGLFTVGSDKILSRDINQMKVQKSGRFTDRERQHLIESIMGVKGEENMNRPAGDELSEDRMQQFRRDIEELDDERLEISWYENVGEWLASRPEFQNDVDGQFQKTLNGNQDYGFVL